MSCHTLHLVFVLLLLLLVARPEHQCSGLVPAVQDGDANIECLPVDIQLYSWSGPGFESGECWYQGRRFTHGATWGRTDAPGAPYCLCEQGKVRVFYTQKHIAADSLTILRPQHGSPPTSNDLAHWPIADAPTIRQRTALCSADKLDSRVRSRDGCIGCKCSKNGHWLCRRPPTRRNGTTNNARQRNNEQTPRANRYPYASIVHLRVTTVRIRPQCPLGSIPQFCILIERLTSSNGSEKASQYIEIPRETSWLDRDSCTRCSCSIDGRLACEYIRTPCSRSCLVHKLRPVAIMYYFPSGSKWITPPNDKCRSCLCINGQRKCTNCDQVLTIDIENVVNTVSNYNPQRSAAIGEYSLLPAVRTQVKVTPCLLKIDPDSHRLVPPGQQTWFEQRCYACPQRGNGRLVPC